MPIDSAFKQLLLDALNTPQVLSFTTPSEAHSARFQAYNAFKVLKKENDPFADMKAMLEFIIRKQPDGSATLSIQRKTTNLMQILSGKKLTNPTSPIPQPAIDLTTTANLQHDIQRTTPKEVDPTDPFDAKILRRMEINDWLETKEEDMHFRYAEACAMLASAGDVTLDKFREMLSTQGIH
jgi:hypothetical protein